jgi:hypothetical protein
MDAKEIKHVLILSEIDRLNEGIKDLEDLLDKNLNKKAELLDQIKSIDENNDFIMLRFREITKELIKLKERSK